MVSLPAEANKVAQGTSVKQGSDGRSAGRNPWPASNKVARGPTRLEEAWEVGHVQVGIFEHRISPDIIKRRCVGRVVGGGRGGVRVEVGVVVSLACL